MDTFSRHISLSSILLLCWSAISIRKSKELRRSNIFEILLDFSTTSCGVHEIYIIVKLIRTASRFSYFHYHHDLQLDGFIHFLKKAFDLSFFLLFNTPLNDENTHFYRAQNVTVFLAVKYTIKTVYFPLCFHQNTSKCLLASLLFCFYS